MKKLTHEEFDVISFHDNRLWGIKFLVNDEAMESDIKLDIDYITKWIGQCSEGNYSWEVAPANLIFHGVTGLKLGIDWQDDEYRNAISGPYIVDLERSLVDKQWVHFDRSYYTWKFSFNDISTLSFGAWGFDLILRKPPVERDNQCLPLNER